MEESPYNNPIPVRLRFSLREILLAMVAICALVALYVGPVRSIPTPFLSGLDVDGALEAIYRDEELGFPAKSVGTSEGFSDLYAQQFSSLTLESPTQLEVRARILPRLHDEIETDLNAAGCEIIGRGKIIVNNREELQGFTFRYSHGDTRGVFRAHTVPIEDDRTRLLIFVDEF